MLAIAEKPRRKSSDDKTEIVTIRKETEAKMSDLKNDYSYEGIADGKQQEQGKPN